MNGKLSVEIPDLDYWKNQIKCQSACPVHTDARGYVRAVAEGDYEKAYLIARAPNPLASICGRMLATSPTTIHVIRSGVSVSRALAMTDCTFTPATPST